MACAPAIHGSISPTPSVYDQWIEEIIIEDVPTVQSGATDPTVVSPEAVGASTMNSILIVDLDGDGANDIVVPLDRHGLSGLTADALVWFQNTQ